MEVIHKIGRRKTAVARVYVSEGKGNITVNKKRCKNLLSYSYFTIQSKSTFSFNK
jgi:small subunit ribosomal protein S9